MKTFAQQKNRIRNPSLSPGCHKSSKHKTEMGTEITDGFTPILNKENRTASGHRTQNDGGKGQIKKKSENRRSFRANPQNILI